MKKKVFTAIGLMSGTSMDGVDLSLIKSDGEGKFTSILDDYSEFNDDLQDNLINLKNRIFAFEDLSKYAKELNLLEKELTLFHGKVLEKVLKGIENKVDLIGFHGQTIFHNSKKKISKQLGDGKLLSQITKKIVINDFRKEDLKNGGQGAPLTPIFHKLISSIINQKFRISYPLGIVNIGGITNISLISDNNEFNNSNLYAYDIAPGNCLIDKWIRRNSNKKFDKDGKIAASGKVDELILNQAIDNFELSKYEQSLDINDFDISFVKGLSLEDGCATLTKFTAFLIAKGIEYTNNLNKSKCELFLTCGGGRKNDFLIKSINENFIDKKNELKKIDDYGFDGDFIESQSFGYLAIRTFLKRPISFPSTTRCLSSTIGGTINKNF